jgi:pimeloyl-ACP methyl ester carboxylesterase
MSDDLSSLDPVKPDAGKYQWVKGKVTGTDDEQADRTHTVGVPYLMPGIIIFVHGVNSDGEWYHDASATFAKGLSQRLGRDDLEQLVKDTKGDQDKVTAHRYLKVKDGERVQSPIIPFWWGYKTQDFDRKVVKGTDQNGNTPAWTDGYGNPLRTDGAWGGGPFQNGGAALASFWLPKGFRKDILDGVIDVNAVNPVLGRTLCDCPPRLYYAHAARRLANLVKDIRKNLPNEPINIVSHSQGTIIALCSLFFLDDDMRGPDTVILNSSPYRFDTQITDYASAADGRNSVQPEPARIQTFAKAAGIVARAAEGFPAAPEPKAECTVEHKPRHAYDDGIYCHKPADADPWQAEIGGKVEDPDGPRGQDGKPWWSDARFARGDTRGKLMVNFNPGDRVIGVSAVSGMGWRGIPSKYMGQVGANVLQRLFARGTNAEHNPPVGSKPDSKPLPYFHKQIVHVPGGPHGESAHDREEWHYLDGSKPNRAWKIPSERVLGVMPVLGNLEPGWRGHVESVVVNAPEVPKPLTLPDKFDGNHVMYDGQAGTAPDGAAVEADAEQQADFEDDVTYQERQTVMRKDEKGMATHVQYETWEEVEQRRRNKVGNIPISPTNHAAILRYSNKDGSSPVANVLSYDVTVGQGYAWHDEQYWNYLLDLADWKKSDPYYHSGKLSDSDKTMPRGIVPDDALAPVSRSAGAL